MPRIVQDLVVVFRDPHSGDPDQWRISIPGRSDFASGVECLNSHRRCDREAYLVSLSTLVNEVGYTTLVEQEVAARQQGLEVFPSVRR